MLISYNPQKGKYKNSLTQYKTIVALKNISKISSVGRVLANMQHYTGDLVRLSDGSLAQFYPPLSRPVSCQPTINKGNNNNNSLKAIKLNCASTSAHISWCRTPVEGNGSCVMSVNIAGLLIKHALILTLNTATWRIQTMYGEGNLSAADSISVLAWPSLQMTLIIFSLWVKSIEACQSMDFTRKLYLIPYQFISRFQSVNPSH